MEGYLHAFLTSTLDGGDWSLSGPGRFRARVKSLNTHRIGGCVDPIAGLDAVVKKKKILFPYRESKRTPVIHPVP
jgi:hypothetical protein